MADQLISEKTIADFRLGMSVGYVTPLVRDNKIVSASEIQ
jgi:hypothetical protein